MSNQSSQDSKPHIDDSASPLDLARLVEESLNEIYVFDLHSLYFINVNRTARENLNYSMEELRGLTPIDLKPDFTEPSFNSMIEPLRSGSETSLIFETVHKRKDGTTYPVEVHLQASTYGGQAVGAAIILDITERLKAESDRKLLDEQLQQAQKMESLGILAGGIAHDFNNILTGILGYADLAKVSTPPESDAYLYIEELVKGVKQASELTRQMLAYSGKGKFIIQPLNLQEVVEDMGRLLDVSISKKCSLSYHFESDIPAIEGDVAQIRQVILNLIVNAAEAIGEDVGQISITIGSMYCDQDYLVETFQNSGLGEGRFVYLEVADSGIGMDAATKERIFDPFFTTKFTGRGLGLSAILGIVLGHKGVIKVYSEPNKGSTFKILFPVVSNSAETVHKFGTINKDWKSTGTVLIIDDEEQVRKLSREMFKKMGFQVLLAVDGEQGVAVFREHHKDISVVMLDMTMPKMNGVETFRELRRIDDSVPTILTSGYNEQTAINQFAGKGLAGFIQKPYLYHQLTEVVKNVLAE